MKERTKYGSHHRGISLVSDGEKQNPVKVVAGRLCELVRGSEDTTRRETWRPPLSIDDESEVRWEPTAGAQGLCRGHDIYAFRGHPESIGIGRSYPALIVTCPVCSFSRDYCHHPNLLWEHKTVSTVDPTERAWRSLRSTMSCDKEGLVLCLRMFHMCIAAVNDVLLWSV